ncbi:MAG TPA: ATP-binding protein [Arachidicoccus sp.]
MKLKNIFIIKILDNIEKDYEHFGSPLILAVEKVKNKIRNLKYRYLKSGTLFPDEVDQYDDYIIREALNNCIAHQDYSLGGKIIVVENEDGFLSFTNAGNFIPQSVEEVVIADTPEPVYRNTFLVAAMVNLNMIDTIGSGIKRMFNIQRKKFFPLPDYDLSKQKVSVTIIGKVNDINYARKLAEMPTLSLNEIILLDMVAKHKILSDDEAKYLKEKKLVEGRKPNYYVSSNVAAVTGNKADYIKLRGFKDEHFKKMILEYLDKFGSADRQEIHKLIFENLPAMLSDKQKHNKIHNILYALSQKEKRIKNTGTNRYPRWTKV